jgi:hypothetical protein
MPWVIIIFTKYIGVWPSELRMACHYTFLQSWFLLGILIQYSAEQKRQSSTTLLALGFKYVTAGRFGLMEVGQKSGNGGEVNGKHWKGRKINLNEFIDPWQARFVLCYLYLQTLRENSEPYIIDRSLPLLNYNHGDWTCLNPYLSVDSPACGLLRDQFEIPNLQDTVMRSIWHNPCYPIRLLT